MSTRAPASERTANRQCARPPGRCPPVALACLGINLKAARALREGCARWRLALADVGLVELERDLGGFEVEAERDAVLAIVVMLEAWAGAHICDPHLWSAGTMTHGPVWTQRGLLGVRAGVGTQRGLLGVLLLVRV